MADRGAAPIPQPTGGAPSPASTLEEVERAAARAAVPAIATAPTANAPPAMPAEAPHEVVAPAEVAPAAARGSVMIEGADRRSATPVPPEPTGSLDKEAIRTAIRAIQPKIAECYESALAHDPDLIGRITVDFTIEAVDGGGGVTAGEVNGTDMNAPFFEACVLKQVVDVPFPAPAGGGVVKVTYPFNFSNGAD
ncbi:MAG: AgmX/PglI C-terminal domain-containing protein [Deltaproteobacteria bacterium]|nr:AgmX/PglI C-terminal domain-containing protein [Deltaproteobacteria bacterium]